jgi:hypothetical protein
MKRLLCGSVVLAASFVLVSCSGDPTSDGRGEPTRITAEPTSLFIDQGTDAAVIVTLIDEQGEPLAGVFEIAATGSGITVVQNAEYLGTTVGPPLESQAQFIVTAGATPTPSAFTLTNGALSIDIPVVVLPTSIETAVFSNPTPAMNEVVSVSAEGFSFLPDAAVSFGPDSALILANDGASLTFLPAPGSTGSPLLEGIAISFLPTTPLSLPTAAPITVASLSAIPGTEDPATAPSLPVPAVDEIARLFDGPDFAATLDHFYKLTVAEAGVYTVTVDWDIGSDIDMFLCPDPGAITADCNFDGATANHPESVDFTLTPGTYFVVVDDFGPIADPPGTPAIGAEIKIDVERSAPSGELRRLSPPTAPKIKIRK